MPRRGRGICMSHAANAPPWLSRVAVAALAVLCLGVFVGPLAVLAGAWLAQQNQPALQPVEAPPPVVLAPGESAPFGPAIPFRATLVVDAVFDAGSDPLAWWGVTCRAADGTTVTYRLTADGYFSIPPLAPDSRAFLHIRPPGQPNRLHIQRGGAHLRINDEIAWDGAPPSLQTCQLAAGSIAQAARLTVTDVRAD